MPIHPQRLSTLFIKCSGLRNLVWANLHKTGFQAKQLSTLQGLARFRRQDNARQDPQEAPARLRRAYSKRQTSAKKAVNETTRQPIIQNQALPTLRQIHPQRPCILFIKCSGLRNLVWANLPKPQFPTQPFPTVTCSCAQIVKSMPVIASRSGHEGALQPKAANPSKALRSKSFRPWVHQGHC